MPLYTRKDFAELCDVDKSYITVYIGRKKITLTGKMIDDSLPDNAYFLQKCLEKKAAKGTKAPTESLSQTVKKPKAPVSKGDVAAAQVVIDEGDDPRLALETLKQMKALGLPSVPSGCPDLLHHEMRQRQIASKYERHYDDNGVLMGAVKIGEELYY